MFRYLFIFFICCYSFSTLTASPIEAGDNQVEYQITIKKASEKIVLDGIIQEKTWTDADKVNNFWMSYPVDNERAKRQTEVMLSYDDNFLYVAASCYSSPNYIIQTLKRDLNFWNGDGFAILLDPVNEKSNGFAFGVNPSGVQMELLVSGSTGRRGSRPSGMNMNWDQKWFSAVKTSEDKWSLEMAIPFKSLRYQENKTTWGVNFIRTDMTDNSYHTWAPVPLQFRALEMGYTGAMHWDKAPAKTKGNVSLIPYVTASSVQNFDEDEKANYKAGVGLDAKIAVSSTLNLDLTVNPDFSQVEVDEQVINLTQFSIRLPEKRTFFLENSDIFEDFGSFSSRPFFSRRIGLNSSGQAIPILYGARLSGNINKDWRMGLMNMHTKSDDENFAQNYSAFAIHRKVFERSNIKAFFLNRQALDGSDFLKEDFGRNAGLEFDYLSIDGKWRFWSGYNHSFQPGIKSNNYYYKFGGNYSGRNFSTRLSYSNVATDYYLDMGFLARITRRDHARDTSYRLGFSNLFIPIDYTLYPKKSTNIISHQFRFFNFFVILPGFSKIEEAFNGVSYRIRWKNRSTIRFELNRRAVNLLYPFSFTDRDLYEPLPVQQYSYYLAELKYESDSRKVFSIETELKIGGFYNGERKSFSIEAKYRQQPWGVFGINFQFNDLSFPEPYGNRQLTLIGPRAEISFSKNLFWTTFLQYNTQADDFIINSRFQWRFAPMSDFYFVYTDNYVASNFEAKSRAFVLKLNYWFTL